MRVNQDKTARWYHAFKNSTRFPPSLELIPLPKSLLHHARQGTGHLKPRLSNLDVSINLDLCFPSSSSASLNIRHNRRQRSRCRSKRKHLPMEGDLSREAGNLVTLFGVYIGEYSVRAL